MLTETKARLRETMRRTRALLQSTGRAAPANPLVTRVAHILDRAPGVVSGYVAIGDELDPAPVLDAARRRGHTVAMPVMVGRDKPLEFRAWAPGDPLVERVWGIREPAESCPAVDPDVLFVPLLAFDAAGNRLGYGGGFYDRSLSYLRAKKTIIAIGLAFDEQRVDEVPHLDTDERLDYVLTPSVLIEVR